jgi:hypothetical protein
MEFWFDLYEKIWRPFLKFSAHRVKNIVPSISPLILSKLSCRAADTEPFLCADICVSPMAATMADYLGKSAMTMGDFRELSHRRVVGL